MMKTKSMTLSLLIAALLAGFSAAPVMAQGIYTPGIDHAQQEIHARIQQGIESGQITQQEAQELRQRERSIQFREIRFKNDGRASPQEREQLRQDIEALRADVEYKLANNRLAGRPDVHTPGIDDRQEEIHARIDRGIASGRITRSEAQRLHQRERDIQRREAR